MEDKRGGSSVMKFQTRKFDKTHKEKDTYQLKLGFHNFFGCFFDLDSISFQCKMVQKYLLQVTLDLLCLKIKISKQHRLNYLDTFPCEALAYARLTLQCDSNT